MAIEDIVIDRTSGQLIHAIDTAENIDLSNSKVEIGDGASATSGAIQIGAGTNNTSGTVKIKDTVILDTTGKIPTDAVKNSAITENKLSTAAKNKLNFITEIDESKLSLINGKLYVNLSDYYNKAQTIQQIYLSLDGYIEQQTGRGGLDLTNSTMWGHAGTSSDPVDISAMTAYLHTSNFTVDIIEGGYVAEYQNGSVVSGHMLQVDQGSIFTYRNGYLSFTSQGILYIIEVGELPWSSYAVNGSGGGGIAYTAGDGIIIEDDEISVDDDLISDRTGRTALDLSAGYNAGNAIDISTGISQGIYDVVKAGYVKAHGGTNYQKKLIPVGTVLIRGDDWTTFYFDGEIYCVDNSGNQVENWNTGGRLAHWQSVVDALDLYLSKTEAGSTYQQKPISATLTSGTVTLADNTEYTGTAIDTLTMNFPSGIFECYISLTTAASGTVTIDFDSSAKFIGDEPVFGNDEEWEISIKNGVVVAGKVS